MKLLPLPAFDDNYIWLLHDGQHALVVDPGDASPVLQALDRHGLKLDAILVTHHHADHVGGLPDLKAATAAPVYGPAREPISGIDHPVAGGQAVRATGSLWQVIDIPGHTAGHVAYWCDGVALDEAPHPGLLAPLARRPVLFCGDTLFSAGCGRLFEGTPAQMLRSLDALAGLPGDALVCCAHEYTLANLRFAAAADPANPAVVQHVAWAQAQRQQGLPTLPTSLALERTFNPFLRHRQAAVRTAVARHDPALPRSADDTTAFAALRDWKNTFR